MCTPSLAIDVIIETDDGSVVLVRRADNGKYATIGGFVDIGESVEATVARELLEETGLALQEGSTQLMGVYSDPRRDHRRHTVSELSFTSSEEMYLQYWNKYCLLSNKSSRPMKLLNMFYGVFVHISRVFMEGERRLHCTCSKFSRAESWR